jgi:chromosome segregation ATPase
MTQIIGQSGAHKTRNSLPLLSALRSCEQNAYRTYEQDLPANRQNVCVEKENLITPFDFVTSLQNIATSGNITIQKIKEQISPTKDFVPSIQAGLEELIRHLNDVEKIPKNDLDPNTHQKHAEKIFDGLKSLFNLLDSQINIYKDSQSEFESRILKLSIALLDTETSSAILTGVAQRLDSNRINSSRDSLAIEYALDSSSSEHLQKLSQELNDANNLLSRQIETLLDLKAGLISIQDKVGDLFSPVSDERYEVAQLRIKIYEKNLIRLDASLQPGNINADAMEIVIDSLQEKLAYENLIVKLHNLQEKYDMTEITARAAEAKSELAKQIDELLKIKAQLDSTKNELHDIKQQTAKVESKAQEATSTVQSTQQQVSTAQTEAASAKEESQKALKVSFRGFLMGTFLGLTGPLFGPHLGRFLGSIKNSIFGNSQDGTNNDNNETKNPSSIISALSTHKGLTAQMAAS